MTQPLVEYNYLSGNSGIKVSNICLGTANFGAHADYFAKESLVSYENASQMLTRFVELGGNFLDTANIYCNGEAEEFIGNWLSSQERDKLIIGTKCGLPADGKKMQTGLSRKAIMLNVEESLKRLKTGYIDLYQIHCWDAGVPLDETLSTLNDLVRAGKVHYLGGNNLAGWQLQRIYYHNKIHGYKQFATLQQLYNILDRTSELEPFEVCQNHGIGILPWSPLKGGLLTGKNKRGVVAEGSRIAAVTKGQTGAPTLDCAPDLNSYTNNEQYWKLDELLHSLAEKHGKSVAQVSLRWLLQRPNVNSVIIGARNVKQLEDNLVAGRGWKLTDEDMSAIDKLSSYDKPYPYYFNESRHTSDYQRPGLPSGRQF